MLAHLYNFIVYDSNTTSDYNELTIKAKRFKKEQSFWTTIAENNNDTNDKLYRKVAFLMYTEIVNIRPQSWKAALKQKPHRGLGTRLP